MAGKRGRPLGRVKLEGDWESAIGTAMKKPRPAGGWPTTKRASKPRRRKRAKRRPS